MYKLKKPTKNNKFPRSARVPMSCDMALSNRVLDPRSLKQELDLSRWFGKIAVLVYLKKTEIRG